MFAKILFAIALCLYGASLFEPAVEVAGRSLMGIETFYYTLRYATSGLFGASSFSDIVNNLLALISTAANFVFVFWAMLVVVPTVVPMLRWFWWLSLIFLVAATYTGLQAALSGHVMLHAGYYFWLAALVIMFIAPVLARVERKLIERARSVRGSRRASRLHNGKQLYSNAL